MGRSPCCAKVGLKKGPWTSEEDQMLMAYVQLYGPGNWRALPARAGLERCGKSCRLRWTNYLRPDIKRGRISLQEEQTIIQLHALLGNRWSAIASHLPKRTDNEIKNYWNTHIKKRFIKMGIDPITHKPVNFSSSPENTDVCHMAQWESARLQAEARLARLTQHSNNIPHYQPRLNIIAPPPFPYDDVLKGWQTQNVSLESPTTVFNFSDNTNVMNIHPPMVFNEAPYLMEELGQENENYWNHVLDLIDTANYPDFEYQNNDRSYAS